MASAKRLRVRYSEPAVATIMASVQLLDIVSEADRTAVLGLRLNPGQERFVASVEESFQEAAAETRACPRMWSVHDDALLVGFVMISDGIPAERLATDDDLIGPYYLWRLLIDARHQHRGYGTAVLDGLVAYLRGRPDADTLWTSAAPGEGTPQPFYERYGFVPTGDTMDAEVVLRLDLRPTPGPRRMKR